MKRLFLVIIALALVGCFSTELVESWKNPEIETYAPSKILVVGLTSNLEARQKFENKLKNELIMRGAEAVSSLDVLNTEKMTEVEFEELEDNLISNGFDTVLFSKVIGVEDKIVYKNNYDGYDATYRKFREDYLKYQDVFYNPEYYTEFKVYHAETAMYCICPLKDRELIWKGYIDIVDPQSTDETVNEYVGLVIVVLEEEQLISPRILKEEEITEESIN